MCTNLTRRDHNETAIFLYFSTTDLIVYFTLSAVSIVSLFITIVFHCICPFLQNTYGRKLASLSLTLMFAQVSSLFSSIENYVVCVVSAITSHFLWLSVFLWMVLIGVDMAGTFSPCTTLSKRDSPSQKRHWVYGGIAWGIPFLFVGIIAILDIKVPGIVIGYGAGSGSGCWITNKTAALILFAVPVAIMILMNFIVFAVTMRGIENSLRVSKVLHKRLEDKQRCLIYIKLALILGLTWVFGFLADITNNARVIWYIFIVLNWLQGLFILLSVVLARRVRMYIRRLFTRSHHQSDVFKINSTI